MSGFNRNFNPNIWDTPRPVHPIPPFANNQQNFYQNQGNFNQFQNNFQPNFQQNQNNIRNQHPQADHIPSLFRNFKNNNNQHNEDNYRRPGPKCSRKGGNFGNNVGRWKQDNNRNEFFNRDNRTNDSFESLNSNPPRSLSNDRKVVEGTEVPKIRTSLVEHLKAVQNLKKNENSPRSDIDAICIKNASAAPQRLLTQLKTMDKDGVKNLINNPTQPYKKKVLNYQAREKLREQMRKRLKVLGTEAEAGDLLEVDESIDYERMPESLMAQIGRTLDINMDTEDMEMSESDDRDLEVIKTNLGNDFLMGSEMLLMNGFSLLAETESEVDHKPFEKLPPLPTEIRDRPPSPPPEPVPPPLLASPSPIMTHNEPVFSSNDKPWSPIPRAQPKARLLAEDWDIESAKNPDAPEVQQEVFAISSLVTSGSSVPSITPAYALPNEELPIILTPSDDVSKMIPVISSVELDLKSNKVGIETSISQPMEEQKFDSQQAPAESGRRANETYGEYRRRLTAEKDSHSAEPNDDVNKESTTSNSGSSNTNKFNKQQSNNQQNQRKNWNEDDRNKFRNGSNNNSNEKWTPNNRRNNQNDQQERKSRFDIDRGRDRNNSSNDNNFQNLRNESRDTNDNGRSKNNDGHNYRFDNEKRSQEPDIDRLNSILNPKPLQFKGSFNKRTKSKRSQSRDSWDREKTPTNNSLERDFNTNLLPSPNDVRPCYTTLKKVMQIDAEMAKLHDKVHGIDKVISNLHLERIGHQKSFTKLQHDRKVLFDNLMKRAMSNESRESCSRSEPSQPKETTSTTSSSNAPSTSLKSQIEKKLQNIVDHKKRKPDEIEEEPAKKKHVTNVVMETTSAAEKAAKNARDRAEEERKKALVEAKRLKRLRRERKEAEKSRLEEKIRREATASTVTTIKTEPRDKSVDKASKQVSQPELKSSKPAKDKSKSFDSNDALKVESYKIKKLNVDLKRVTIAQNLAETFKMMRFVEISPSDWEPVKIEGEVRIKKEDEKLKGVEGPAQNSEKSINEKPVDEVENPTSQIVKPIELKPEEDKEESLVLVEYNEDPLAFDETSMNPPTPGSNIYSEDSLLVESKDYSEWAGSFNSHDQPIVHMQNILNQFVVCASESGKVYKYNLKTGELMAIFSKHTEICNSFLYDNKGSIYTVSSDGFLYKIKYKTFQSIASDNFNEPLQVIEKSKVGIFVGTKTGRIFRLKTDLTERETDPICNLGALILCMRAAKEGSRNILLVSSRTHAIQVRDAIDGLLLRTLSDNLAGVSIYDMLIEGSTIYCGSNKHEIFSVDFTTGALKKSRPCGAGAICVKLYKNLLIAACYDGNIYIFNTTKDDDAVNICGPSNMLLAMDLWDDKIVATTKDKTMKIMTIPT